MRPTRFDLRRLAAIYAGGVLGALARVGLAAGGAARAGRLALGDLRGQHGRGAAARLLRRPPARPPRGQPRPPFLTTGICGTLTTFSTLQLELFEMVDGGRLGLAAAYVAATLAAGYVFVRLGIALERRPEAPNDGRGAFLVHMTKNAPWEPR